MGAVAHHMTDGLNPLIQGHELCTPPPFPSPHTMLEFYPPTPPVTNLLSLNKLCYTFLSPKNLSPNPARSSSLSLDFGQPALILCFSVSLHSGSSSGLRCMRLYCLEAYGTEPALDPAAREPGTMRGSAWSPTAGFPNPLGAMLWSENIFSFYGFLHAALHCKLMFLDF